jgi:hypothetical protein
MTLRTSWNISPTRSSSLPERSCFINLHPSPEVADLKLPCSFMAACKRMPGGNATCIRSGVSEVRNHGWIFILAWQSMNCLRPAVRQCRLYLLSSDLLSASSATYNCFQTNCHQPKHYSHYNHSAATFFHFHDTANMEGTNLPSINRFITAHNAEGKAVFSDKVPEALGWDKLPNGAGFALGYTTEQYPVDLNQDKDVSKYQTYLSTPPGLVIPGGTVLRFVDCPPNSLSPMHRTVSLDYGVVLEGEVVLELDSGETRSMKRGDVAIQRGTNHAWRNPSSTNWARMMYVLQESQPILLGEKALGEDYGEGMDGVPASGTK